MVCPLTPTKDFSPNIPAILAPMEVSEVHALVRTMSITNTGRRKKKPEIATRWRLEKNAFVRDSCLSTPGGGGARHPCSSEVNLERKSTNIQVRRIAAWAVLTQIVSLEL